MELSSHYFEKYYPHLRLPIEKEGLAGLRDAQRGAYHALASHFTLSQKPGLVVMPTGSGKTAVLMMIAYGLRAKRVLVITPSVLVRRQIAERFGSLTTLRRLGVVASDENVIPGPSIHEVASKIRDDDDWQKLRNYDVIVGTPFSLSPGAQGVAPAPSDLFDLILIDEAHHGRAKTWEALLEAFPNAQQIHFTATPFRRDDKPLKAKIAYSYSLSNAYRDGIFGEIIWDRVEAYGGQDPDVAIALRADAVFRRDVEAGYQHLLMVRTDSKSRANDLKTVYAEHTNLNLRLVHSGLAPSTIKTTISKLRNGGLDGIICVDMLGEGFDLPALKIAAVHAPHRSLGATLQFIGRFARTAVDTPLGSATFIAIPSDIEIERKKLFEESEAWQEIVTNLSEGRIQEEVDTREQLGTFERVVEPPADLQDISIHAFSPLKHVKIYRIHRPVADVDITTEIEAPKPLTIIERWNSPDLSTTVFITQMRTRPEWTRLEELDKIEYDLFVVYHDREANLLFINASRRTQAVYEKIARAFTEGQHRILPLSQVNNVLATLSDFHFFNIGMRRRALHPNAETYQIKAGTNTQDTVRPEDGVMYDRGHVACIGVTEEGTEEYIGYSSSSKVWSGASVLIPTVVEWARILAQRIENFTDVQTGSGIDHLSIGVELDRLPENIIAADWPRDVYTSARRLTNIETGETCQLVETELNVNRAKSADGVVRLQIILSDECYEINYALDQRGPFFTAASENCEYAVVSVGHEEIALLDYLHEHAPPLFLADFSAIHDGQLFKVRGEIAPFDPSQFLTLPWEERGVDIRREFKKDDDQEDKQEMLSIHDFLMDELPNTENEIVFYDHGSGEMADFVTFERSENGIRVSFFHCKGATGDAPGSRVGDVYEVASQVTKSLIWLRDGPSGILGQVKHRMTTRAGSWFVRGDLDLLKEVVSVAQTDGVTFRMVLVQPGLSKTGMKDNVTTALGAADRFIIDHNCEKLCVWGSS